MIDKNSVSVILCAGKGSRMNSARPKVLNTICGKSMLGYILDAQIESGIGRIIIVCNSENIDLIRSNTNKDIEIDYVVQSKQLGTADALKVAATNTNFKDISNLFVFLGDTPLVTNSDITYLSDSLKSNDILIASFETENPTGYGRIIRDNEGRVCNIIEEGDATTEEKSIKTCFSGIIIFNNISTLSLLDNIKNDNSKKEFYLTDVIKMAYNNNLNVRDVLLEYDSVKGVNDYIQLSQAEKIMSEKIMQKFMKKGVHISLADTSFIHPDTQFGKNVTVEPNVYIGEDVIIGDDVNIKSFSYLEGVNIKKGATIGPFARIRPESNIGENSKVGNFVELKNANVADNVKISHLSYIGDASLGSGTNIGAGTITCNFDGVEKYKTIIGKNAFIGSNSSLIAPIEISDNSYIGSGSVITKDVPTNSLALSRSEQVTKNNWVKKRSTKK